MNYGIDERAGRNKLTVLLILNLALAALPVVLTHLAFAAPPVYFAVQLLPLLPLAVILWSLFRGSWPGLVLFVITTVNQLADVLGLFQFGGVGALNRQTALSLMALLLRLTTVLALFQHEQVTRYWAARQDLRRRRTLILEIVLFALSLIVGYLPSMLFLWSGNF